MNSEYINSQRFDTHQCLAKQRTPDVTDCLSSDDIFIFCPYVLFFRGGRLCKHPEQAKIIAQSKNDDVNNNPILEK